MKKTTIAIACQGGGAQTAFTAGALQALFDAGIEKQFDIASIGGTSGGAVCASLVWYALQTGERPVCQRLLDFWTDNSPQVVPEAMFNNLIVAWSRLVGRGYMPTLEMSPYSPLAKYALGTSSYGHRRTFSDFRECLQSHLDFEQIRRWGPQRRRPILVLGAANVLTGKMRKFVSSKEVIQIEHILASSAVPNIFPAVKIGEDAYWDGLFSDNPQIEALIRPVYVGAGNIPDEIWLIKIDPTARRTIPEAPDDILDRRKQMEGNISMFQQLAFIELLNDMLLGGAFTREFIKGFEIPKAIRIPKAFAGDPDKPYHIPLIEMSPELYSELDWEAKLDRGTDNIKVLMEDGRTRAREFLEQRQQVMEGLPRRQAANGERRRKLRRTAAASVG